MKTLSSYDELPYDGVPVPETQMDYLVAVARLFGLPAANPKSCRVLELGCAEGGNLIPLAWYAPGSEFVGVELSAVQASQAQATIASLNLSNVRVIHGDILEIGPELGEFDYIIAHGVYSWVPPAVQESILALCHRHLAPNGVAYVSYNTLPGWHARALLRDMLLIETRLAHEPRAKLKAAYEFFDWFEAALTDRDMPEISLVLAEIAFLRRASPAYLYHEFLTVFNEPVTFTEFMSRAAGHGLQYLADTALHIMLPGALREDMAQLPGSTADRMEREQHADYLSMRPFRRSLLCRRDQSPQPHIDMRAFQQFAFCADLSSDEEIDLGSPTPQVFTMQKGGTCRISHPLTKAAAMYLASVYPDCISMTELEGMAAGLVSQYGSPGAAGETEAFRREWLGLAVHQAIRMSTEPERVFREVSERPRAHRLARIQAGSGAGIAASVRHQGLGLDVLGARLLAMLDGSMPRLELVRAMMQLAETGAGGVPAITQKQAEAACDRLLWMFARNGLLEA